MSLSDLIREIHGPNELIPLIEFHLKKFEDGPREVGWHPSEFCDSCARHDTLARLLDKLEPFIVEPRLRRIFDFGTAIHELYQNKYLGPMGILWGKWKCLKCSHLGWGFMPKEKHDCGGGWNYLEVPVKKDDLGLDKPIVGHSDGLLHLDEWYTFEMKSINENGFNNLLGPKRAHRNQAEIYGGLIRRGHTRGVPDGIEVPKPTKTLVLYIQKNRSIEKEFSADLDDDLYKKLIDYPVQMEDAMETEELPERHWDCANIGTRRAKGCKLSSYCFGRKSWDELVQLGKKAKKK